MAIAAKKIKRNRGMIFIKKTSAGIIMAIPAYLMLSCSSSDDGGNGPGNSNPDPDPANFMENGTNLSISANHGHSMVVSKEDVSAGVEKTYTLSEANTDHTFIR